LCTLNRKEEEDVRTPFAVGSARCGQERISRVGKINHQRRRNHREIHGRKKQVWTTLTTGLVPIVRSRLLITKLKMGQHQQKRQRPPIFSIARWSLPLWIVFFLGQIRELH